VALVIALAYAGWQLWSRRAPAPPPETPYVPQEYRTSELKVLQFYSPSNPVLAGQAATLCYGVLNATAARIEPGVGAVSPSLSRCVNVSPRETTTYTLTAEDGRGNSVTAKLELAVKQRP
jgi:hypothetical protein